MEKLKNYYIVAWLILALTFVVLFFLVVDTEKDNAAWVSFGFVLLSFAALPIVYLLRNKEDGKQVLSYALYRVYSTYFICELIAALFFLLILPGHRTISISVHLIIFAAFVSTLLIHKGANIATTESLNAQKQDGSLIRDWKARLELIKAHCVNPELSLVLSHISDQITSMPIGVVNLTTGINNEITRIITDMSNAEQIHDTASLKELCNNLTSKLEQRKLMVKNNNYEQP